jgi:aminopeptidase C
MAIDDFSYDDLFHEEDQPKDEGFDLGQIERILGTVEKIVNVIGGMRQSPQPSMNQLPVTPAPIVKKFTVDTLINVLGAVEKAYGDIPISELRKEVVEHKDELAKIMEKIT